jgi:hypothetical protein
MAEHQKGTTATTAHGSYAFMWFCAFPTKKQAICFEHYLKSGSGIAFTRRHLIS